MSRNYYYIKSRSVAEMNWWASNGATPYKHYLEYAPVTKWSRFKLHKNYDALIDQAWRIHEMIKELEEFRFHRSDRGEYYLRNTPVNTFRLPKRKGGFREITVFSEEYKQIHLMLIDLLEEFFPHFPDSTGAYIKGKSQLDTVKAHQHAKAHLSLDLENFYPSIETEGLENVLKQLAVVKANLSDESIRRLSIMATYGGSLAQGSSISPILSNIFSLPLDFELYELVKNTNVTYTKFADDISLSSPNVIALPRKRELESYVAGIQDRLNRLYNRKVKINKSKTKLQFSDQIKILGITIRQTEEGPNFSVGKTRKNQYGKELFDFLCDINDGNIDGRLLDYQTVRGKIEYLKQFEPSWFDNQQVKLRRTFSFTGDVWSYILSVINIETE